MIKVCSLNTNYTRYGQGENVLFLHGWGSSMKDFEGSAKVFSKNYCVINVDLWGFGGSEEPTKVWGTIDYAKALHEFTKKLKLNSFHLVGHSFGGKIAIMFSNLFGSDVKSLTLVDSAGMKRRFSLKNYFKIKRYKHLKKMVENQKVDEQILKKFGSNDYKNSSGIMKQILTKVVNENVEQESKSIKLKTLIVWGKKDKDTPLYMARKIHKNITGSKLCVLDGGHFSHIDCFQEFNIILEQFWRSL